MVRRTKSKIPELNILSREFCFPDYIQLPTSSTGPLFLCLWNWWPKGYKHDFLLLWQIGDLELQESRKYDKMYMTKNSGERREMRSWRRLTSTGRGSSQLVVLKVTCLPLPQSKCPCLTQFPWRTRTRKMNPRWCNSCIASVCVCMRLCVRGQPWCNCHQGHSRWGHGRWGYMQQAPCDRAALGAVLFLWFPYFWHPSWCLAYSRCSINACWMTHWMNGC